MATHTWNFYVHLGRSYNQAMLSGATITAYSSSASTSSPKASVTTNASGYCQYQITMSTTNDPTKFYWRVHMPANSSLKEYEGLYIVGKGSATHYWGTPSSTWNTAGTAIVSPSYNAAQNVNCSVTVHFFVVLSSVVGNISSSKFLTCSELSALMPPNGLSAWGASNECVTRTRVFNIISGSPSDYFSSYGVTGTGTTLVAKNLLIPYTVFVSGSSSGPTITNDNVPTFWSSNQVGSSYAKTLTLSCSSPFTVSAETTYGSSWFVCRMSKTGSTSCTVTMYPSTTYTSSGTRTAEVTFYLLYNNSTSFSGVYAPNVTRTEVTYSYIQYGTGTGGGGGGGTSTTSLASIGEFDEI